MITISFHLFSDSHPIPGYLCLENIVSRSRVCLHIVRIIRCEDMCWSRQSCHSSEGIARIPEGRSYHVWHLENSHFLCKVRVPGLPISQIPTMKGTTAHGQNWVYSSWYIHVSSVIYASKRHGKMELTCYSRFSCFVNLLCYILQLRGYHCFLTDC